jgi:hypothetical protein
MANLEPVMKKPATMTDIDFLEIPQLTQRNHLYLYRAHSALLRPAVRAKVKKQAELDGRDLKDITSVPQELEKPPSLAAEPTDAAAIRLDTNISSSSSDASETVLLPSLYETVTEVSLFGDTLTVCDLGDKTLKQPPLDDVERALQLIARNATEQSVCLLVPETHAVVKGAAWTAAVDAIGLIKEPMVTQENYLAVARCYFLQSRLGDLQYLSDNRRFLNRLKKFVELGKCTPFALSIQIDLIVLGEMEGGAFRETNEVETKRRDRLVLPETLRRFLDDRDTSSFSLLMLLVDRLRHDRMLEPHEIVTRIYRATAGTLESRDKRYRRLEDPAHCAWGALLLANESSFLNGSTFVSMDDLCQRYGRAARVPAWFGSRDGWQAIAPLLEIRLAERPNRLDNARLELQRALRTRLEALEAGDIAWFRWLICSSGKQGVGELINEQLPALAAEVR